MNKKVLKLAKYIGRGMFVVGVPAKDLNPAEWLAYSEQERKHFVSLGLFEEVFEKEKLEVIDD